MTGSLSPDGKWMWDGNNWIPAPPQVSPLPMPTTHAPYLIPTHDTLPLVDPLMPFEVRVNRKFGKAKLFAVIGVSLLLVSSLTFLIFYLNQESCDTVGRLTSDRDEPLGGIIDSTTTYTYSSDGFMILAEEVSWEGAMIDRTTYTYDDSNNLIEEYRVFDSEFSRETMTYDSNGNMLTKDTKDSYSFNDDERRIYSYNSNGDIIMLQIDIGIDGLIDEKTVNEYIDGQESFSYTDLDMDGDFDTSETYYYDSNDRLLEIKTDENMDGSVDDITLFRYNSDGELTEMKSDYDNDGSYEFTYTYSFDDEGRPSQSILNIDFDGTWLDSRSVSVYTYTDEYTYTVTTSIFEGSEQTSTTVTEYGCVA